MEKVRGGHGFSLAGENQKYRLCFYTNQWLVFLASTYHLIQLISVSYKFRCGHPTNFAHLKITRKYCVEQFTKAHKEGCLHSLQQYRHSYTIITLWRHELRHIRNLEICRENQHFCRNCFICSQSGYLHITKQQQCTMHT